MEKIAAALKLEFDDLFEKEDLERPEQVDARELPSNKYLRINESLQQLSNNDSVPAEMRNYAQRERSEIGDVDPEICFLEADAFLAQGNEQNARARYFDGLRYAKRMSNPLSLKRPLANYLELAENAPLDDIRLVYTALKDILDYDLSIMLALFFASNANMSNESRDQAYAEKCFIKAEEFRKRVKS